MQVQRRKVPPTQASEGLNLLGPGGVLGFFLARSMLKV